MVQQCTRCGSTEQMTESPVPGKLGEKLVHRTCQKCWDEWDDARVMLINEHRLNLAVPQHFEVLMGEMRTFLQWPE